MVLQGKRIVVTGGAQGLGRCLVDRLLASEARIAVFDVNAQALNQLAAKHADVQCVECDVSDYDKVQMAIDGYCTNFGAPEALVNNAGILYSAPLVRLTPTGIEKHSVAAWHKVLASDLSSVFYMTVCVVEKMIMTRTKGVIVNISSVSAAGNAGQTAYSAAKAGVEAMTVTWAKELSPLGIRVAAVAPGFAETDSTKLALSEATLRETVRRVPLRRLARPEEIADGVIWVLENDFFNGKVLALDGGLIV